jgi:hypothetical protein
MQRWLANTTRGLDRSPKSLREIRHGESDSMGSLVCFWLPMAFSNGRTPRTEFKSSASLFLKAHCIDCHGANNPEGNLSLNDLETVDEINAGVWKRVWAQVTLKEMPPKDAEQPKVVERLAFSDWVVNELTHAMRDKGGFHDHLDPEKGNFVDHDLLFGPLPEGIQLVPTSSPARLWRVTPQELITRHNELINAEPSYDPDRPGLRSHGDAVPTNHGGELKLYFGTDNIIKWQGGTVAYATAVKSVPSVLSSSRKHGLENYPDLATVNSAEATQIMSLAGDLIRYMAYGPLSIAQPYQITDDPDSIADKMKGDLRGLPTSLVYSTRTLRPITPIYDLMKEEPLTQDRLRKAVDYLFETLTFRTPSSAESDSYLTIVKQSIEKLGDRDGAVLGLSSIFLDRDALFRPELIEYGKPDAFGRVMLQDWELGLAVNHALRYLKPDEALRRAIVGGRMRTKADVEREVDRFLADESIRKPRLIQFFRDYFDYDLCGYVCKDTKALAATGANTKGKQHYTSMFDSMASTDRLVEMILQEDQEVLKQLLTTDKVVATEADKVYFGEYVGPIANLDRVDKGRAKDAKKNQPDHSAAVKPAQLSGPTLFARVSRRSFGNGSMMPERILSKAPEGQRLGILTHPSWLVSHSDAMDNHPIRRGRWIRERLLGGGIPDVPITVDAMLPNEPHHTLRERMRVTREDYCWTCHRKMDPLGLPFEMYNHAGLYRRSELNQPVDTSGEIIDSGDPAMDTKVSDAIELIQRIASSERTEQVFVRHAFRFWMGRNETLNDGPILQAAHRAYRDGGGSMKALLKSLLTSDAFLYRTRN